MSLLPPLSDDEREEIERQKQEDAEREMRLTIMLDAAAATIREAQRTMSQARKELRFPLDSVRVDRNDAR